MEAAYHAKVPALGRHMATTRKRKRRRAKKNPESFAPTFAWVVGGAFVAAYLIKKLVQEPIDRARASKQ